MAQDRGLGIGAFHAAPVVRDADKARAAAHDLYLYGGRARVDGVLHEFFHHGGGTLDDLARRDLVDGRIVENMNPRHLSPASFRACSCRR